MLIVGLSGGVATGKSTVSGIFKEHGVPIIDADLIARQVVQPGTPAYGKLRKEFGDEYFDDEHGGVLRRKKLGQLVFNDEKRRKKLNAITHSAIRWEMLKQFLYYLFTGTTYIVFDTPLLFEVGYDKFIGTTIVVFCDHDKELIRMIKRDNLSVEDAESRIKSQMSLEEKKKRGKILIDNNGGVDDLRDKVEEIIKTLNKSWAPFLIRVALGAFFGILPLILFKNLR